MIRTTLRAAPAAFVALVLAEAASAQPSATVTLGGALNRLVEAGTATESRQTVFGSADVEHLAAGDRLRLFYDFSGGTFSTAGDWRYYLNSGGATWRITLDEKKKSYAYLGGSAAWRANGASWAAADFRAVSLLANAELRPRETATIRFGYRLDARDFPDLPELNQVQHDGFASLLLNFPSRTTLIGEAHLGAKSYEATVLTTMPSTIVTPGSPAAAGAGMMGRGMGPGLRGAGMTSGSTSRLDNRAGMLTVFGRVAQSLDDRTGLLVQYTQRTTFGRVPPVVVTTPALFFDDGVYDDPFASNSRAAMVQLKRSFASGVEFEAAASRFHKDYAAAVALDLEGSALGGDPLRADRITQARAGFTLPLFPKQTGAVGFDLDLTYSYTRHSSNDAFYNYTSNAVIAGLTIGY